MRYFKGCKVISDVRTFSKNDNLISIREWEAFQDVPHHHNYCARIVQV